MRKSESHIYNKQTPSERSGGVKCLNAGKLSPFPYHRHINQQDHVHQQCINDCRDGHLSAVEDERGGGYGNGLGSVLHPYLNNNGASDSI